MNILYIINSTNGQAMTTLYLRTREIPRNMDNHKEDVMRVKSLVTIGCLSMMVAAGVANASEDAASKVPGVSVSERIGAGGSVYSSSQSDSTGLCSVTGANITERIGHGGSTYHAKSVGTRECNGNGRMVDVIERIGVGGSIHPSIYSSSHPIG